MIFLQVGRFKVRNSLSVDSLDGFDSVWIVFRLDNN